MNAAARAHVLIVEDDADLARGLAFNLEHEGHRVSVARDAAAARRALSGGAAPAAPAASRASPSPTSSSSPVELVVLDLQLPDDDGLALLRSWRGGGCAVPVICLTARSQETDVVTGLQLGADDYVTKPFSLAQLLARIEAVLRRARSAAVAPGTAASSSASSASTENSSVVELGSVRVDLAAHVVHRPDGDQELTPIEADLLRYLLARRGRVLDRAELLKSMWGVERRHETRTLDNHVARLRKKIELDPARPRFLTTVHGVGYRFESG
ncbi:MAG TPA: response regulator transcription factor [Planctomycetota bacterium]|nr:response regulator transcription factor [Planctomycetota bacterium]